MATTATTSINPSCSPWWNRGWPVWFLQLLVFSGAAGSWPLEPSFVGTITNKTVTLGSDAVLTCQVQNLGNYTIGWSKTEGKVLSHLAVGNHMLTHNNPRVSVIFVDRSIYCLHWKGVAESDTGPYVCLINTDPVIYQKGYLQIAVPPNLDESSGPGDVLVQEGLNVSMECRAHGYPTPSVTWRKEDPSDNNNSVMMGEGEVLHMVSVSRLDMGAYLCVASNGIQPSVSRKTQLKVKFFPMIRIPNQQQEASLGKKITLECNTEAYPHSINYWTNQWGEMITDAVPKYDTVTREDSYKTYMSLTIHNLTAEDFTTYLCIAKNSLGETDGSIKLHGSARPGPSFVGTIANNTVTVGRDAVLSCQVQNLGSYKVAWIQVKPPTLLTIHKWVISRNPRVGVTHERVGVAHEDPSTYRLHLKDVVESDRGFYMCQINTGPTISQMGYLQIVVPPRFEESSWPGDLVVREGINVSLECRARGYPPPTVTWLKEDPSDNNNSVVVGEGEVLHIVRVSRLDMGAYMCVASNGIQPSVSKRTQLKVEYPPMIWIPKVAVAVKLGEPITVECNTEAYPRSINYWTNQRGEILSDAVPKYDTVTRVDSYKTYMRLTIHNLTAEDFTSYRCIAKNSLGETDDRSVLLYDEAAASELPDTSIVGTVANNTVTVGRDAVLSCEVKNLRGYKVAWVQVETQTILTIQNKVITPNPRVGVSYEDQSIYRLHLKDVVESDRGFYMCQINTDPMINQTGYVQITVPPCFEESSWPGDSVVREGINVSLECRAQGYPPPTVTWFKEDLSDNNNSVVVGEGEVLHMVKVSRLDMGTYLCVASNGIQPSVSRRTQLKVQFPPLIRIPNRIAAGILGGQITVECNTEAHPRSINYWTNDLGEMLPDDVPKYDMVTYEDSYKTYMSLTIHNLAAEDFTFYHCIAKNSQGMPGNSIILIYEIFGSAEEEAGEDGSLDSEDSFGEREETGNASTDSPQSP